MDDRTERRAEAAYAEFRRTRGPRAMAEVFDLTAGELLLFARRFARDAAGAEDLVQQTFVRAIERAEQFDPSRRLLPWLTTILANEARMVHRRPALDAARVHVPPVVEPAAAAAQHEAQGALQAAFAALSAECRDVVALRHLHGMPPREIARALGVPVATVKTRLRRGVERLAASLPQGLAFGTALALLALLAGRGMAATRRTVVAHAGDLAATTVVSLGGVVMTKKLGVVVGAAALACLGLSLWLLPGPPSVAAPTTDVAPRATVATATVTAAVAAEQAAATERSHAVTPAPAAATSAPHERVPIDLVVRAGWKLARTPAARVPLELLVQPNARLATQWTDDAGRARFVLDVSGRHWLTGVSERQVSVTTPLRPGRFGNVVLGPAPGVLDVELDDGARIVGTVVDAANQPVSAADVRLTTSSHPDAVVARSDAAGAFALVGLPPDFVLRASAGAMESAPATIAHVAGGERLVLRLDRAGDRVQVRVVAGDRPVADATVRLDTGHRSAGQRHLVGGTGADGVATFAGLPADRYVVEVVHREHPPAQRQLTTEGLGVTRVETVHLGESGSLVGIVRRGGRPEAGVVVLLAGADSLFHRSDMHTDRAGRFTAARLPVGTHWLLFAKDATSDTRQLTVRAGEQTAEFDLAGGTDIVGRLRLPDGGPAARWNVAAQRTDEIAFAARAVTDADGRFTCANLPTTGYRLVVAGPDGGGHTFFDVRTDGEAADYTLPTASLWRPATIVGRFATAPVGAVVMRADDRGNGGGGASLGADGAIALGPLAPGRHRVWLEHDDAVPWLTEVELASGQMLDLGDVALPRCGAVAVAVRGAPGIDGARARVALRGAVTTGGGAFGPALRPNGAATWCCERVPAGEWWLLVGGDGVAADVRRLVVEPDAVSRVDVVLAPAVVVEMRYSLAGGDARALGWRRETVRRAGDGVIVCYRELVGSPRTCFDLAPGSYTFGVETGSGHRGAATFDAPAAAAVEVSLVRR